MKLSMMPTGHTPCTRTYAVNLDGLRGFVALIVAFHHILRHKYSLDPFYYPESKWLPSLPGHSSVLLFFILSGYVIGLTYSTPLTRQSAILYLRKRLVRLYPIYVASLLFTLFIATRYYSPLTIAGHFLFLQNAAVPYIWENNPVWSLNNEVLYYLLFIPISYFRLAPSRVCAAALLLGVACATLLPLPLLSSYCLGFVFWTCGLWLAQSQRLTERYASRWVLAGLMCLFIGYEYTSPFCILFLKAANALSIKFIYPASIGISLIDLLHLPFCLYLIVCFTNHTLWRSKLILLGTIGPCFFYYFYTVFKYGYASPQSFHWLLPILSMSIGIGGLLVAQFRPRPSHGQPLPTLFIKLGAISYGVYIIHFPISIALSSITIFSGSWLTFSLRLLVDIGLVLSAAWLLETKLQPWFRARLNRKPAIHGQLILLPVHKNAPTA